MKIKREIIIVMFSIVFLLLLAACESSSKESSAALDNNSQNSHSSQNTKDFSTNIDSKENVLNKDNNNGETSGNVNPNEEEDISNNVPTKDEDSSNRSTANLKEVYLKKLNEAKIEVEKMEAEDTSTYALKKVENDRFDVWDALLNEIYGVLKEELTPEKMDQLRTEQRNWITYRDDSAKEASLKFQGGTMEHLEYVAVLANLTEERCYEIVEDYMK
ncbi:lysozyme inhibitor LprI family protein [Cytobacillus massiliigabonensis]|uniref:lysozyme inhibitor LprI family protein n=1 Tax=Cytobacillus massiliigabonensis TaxID=1871011 RepID=UPI000C82CEB3|nr:lysozyme inhibitor LprI family protein [Cytobacillus massiliigabonensis]